MRVGTQSSYNDRNSYTSADLDTLSGLLSSNYTSNRGSGGGRGGSGRSSSGGGGDDGITELESLIEIIEDKMMEKDSLMDSIRHPKLLLNSLNELNELVGMDRLKDSIALQVIRLLDSISSGESSAKMLNTILYGPPGVGKTKVGIILAKIWFSLGYLKKPESGGLFSGMGKGGSGGQGGTGGTGGNPSGDEEIPWIPLIIFAMIYLGTYIVTGMKYAYNQIGLLWLIAIVLGTMFLLFVLYNNQNTYNWVANVGSKDPVNYSAEQLSHIKDRDIITVVSRQDFVADYLGQTATKTKKLLQANLGKVLFIDEAYSLLNDGRDSYGMEALTTLNLFMSEHPDSIAVIFAGYRDLMEHGVFSAQPGLPRRCMWHFECDEYDGEQLYDIFMRQVEADGWSIRDDCQDKIRKLICNKEELFKSFGGDTERLLFYSQLEASRSNLTRSGGDRCKVLNITHVREGMKRLRDNNIKS